MLFVHNEYINNKFYAIFKWEVKKENEVKLDLRKGV